MKVNVVTKNGVSALSFKTDFNEVLDKNFAAICEAIANKGKALKELLNLFEECDDEFLEVVWLTPARERGENAAKYALSEELGISLQTAQYLLDMTLEDLAALNATKLKKMLDEYKTNISKLVV